MDVERSYRLTEVGRIPDAWSVVPLNDCLELLTDFEANGSFEAAAANVRVYDSENYAWYVRATDLENATGLERVKYVDRRSYEFLKKTALFGGEVLIAKRGEIGKVYFFELKSKRATLAPNLYLLKLNKRVVPKFLFAYFSHGNGNQILKKLNASTSLGALYKNDVKAIPVPVPPLEEQRAIAEALGDVDALIGALEQLIAKKRDIKQAAMQQLLTGRTRLPGFSGDWKETTLGAVSAGFTSGATPWRGRRDYYTGHIPWITSGELNYNLITDTKEKLTREAVRTTNLRLLPIGTFLMAITGLEAEGTRGSCGIVGVESTTNQSCMALFPTSALRTDFLFHYYVLSGDSLAFQYCQGTKQQSYTASIVKRLPIVLPPTMEEQLAIANVLTEMDTEITALQARLAKTRDIKQGMMQELLTGRTRLV